VLSVGGDEDGRAVACSAPGATAASGPSRRRTLGLGLAAALTGAGVLAGSPARAAVAPAGPDAPEGTRRGGPECLADLMGG
jgi:hypothetical protein